MNENQLYWLSLFNLLLCALLCLGVSYLAFYIMRWIRYRYLEPKYIDHLIHDLAHEGRFSQREVLDYVTHNMSDYRERRNKFWTTFGQILLSIFIVSVLTVMMLAKIIEPDAGLPILSGYQALLLPKLSV